MHDPEGIDHMDEIAGSTLGEGRGRGRGAGGAAAAERRSQGEEDHDERGEARKKTTFFQQGAEDAALPAPCYS